MECSCLGAFLIDGITLELHMCPLGVECSYVWNYLLEIGYCKGLGPIYVVGLTCLSFK